MKKRYFSVIILFASIPLVIVTAALAYDFLNPLSYIERTTGIEFPRGISQIESYDNFEYLIMAHVRLPNGAISKFIEEHNFSAELPDEYKGFSYTASNIELRNLNFQTQFLKQENQMFPSDAILYFLNGRNNSNCWIYALDKRSGRIWVAVYYPDRSGDLFCRQAKADEGK